MLEEQCRGHLRHLADNFCSFCGFLALYLAFVLVLLEACIVGTDYALYLGSVRCGVQGWRES